MTLEENTHIREEIASLIVFIRENSPMEVKEGSPIRKRSRAEAVALTKLEEAAMWLREDVDPERR